MLSVSRRGLAQLKTVLAGLRTRPDFDALDMPALLNALIADGAAIEVLYVHGHWRGGQRFGGFPPRRGFCAFADAGGKRAWHGTRRSRA